MLMNAEGERLILSKTHIQSSSSPVKRSLIRLASLTIDQLRRWIVYERRLGAHASEFQSLLRKFEGLKDLPTLAED